MSYILERAGSLLAAAGIAWAAWAATNGVDLNDFTHDAFRRILQQQGPMEVCALGIVIWILGKWRKHTLLK